MTNVSSIGVDQVAFVAHAENYWTAINGGSTKKANAQSVLADKIVARWDQAGKAKDLLLPLLEHPSAAARCAAATWLLKYDAREEAVRVLRRLQTEPVGLIASAAEVALMRHRIPLKAPH